MAFRFRHHARQRATFAAVVGVAIVAIFGPTLMVPAVALVALVYYAHQLVAAAMGDVDVPYPSLAFVIVVNSVAVLLVQALVFVSGLQTRM